MANRQGSFLERMIEPYSIPAELLACLAPFSTVFNTIYLPQYTAHLKAQPALAHLPFGRWQEVLQAAADWGKKKLDDSVLE